MRYQFARRTWFRRPVPTPTARKRHPRETAPRPAVTWANRGHSCAFASISRPSRSGLYRTIADDYDLGREPHALELLRLALEQTRGRGLGLNASWVLIRLRVQVVDQLPRR
jgi:hypothetical protein